MTNSIDSLPPEMQERLKAIMANSVIPGVNAPAAPAAPTAPAPVAAPQPQMPMQVQQSPIVKPPSLMDHIIALRHEVGHLNQQVAANSQVVEAVGEAVGQLYNMFCQQTETSNPGATYSAGFQEAQGLGGDDY